MESMKCFKAGVSTASDSFYLLWKQPVLLVYFGIATIIKIVVTVLTTAYSLHDYNAVVHFFLIHLPSQCIIVPLTVFAQVTLTHHTALIMDGLDTTVYKSIRTVIHKWQPIL